jgi:hypothetical protein
MKRHWNELIFVLCLVYGFTLVYSQNYIVDPGFEDTTLNAYNQAWWSGTGSFILDSTIAHTGSQSLKIQSNSGGTATVWQVFPVGANTTYQYTGWAMTQGYNPAGGKTGLEVKTGSTDTTWLQDIYSSSAANATTWTQFTILLSTGATDTVITAIMDYGLFGSGATGNVWFDDLSFILTTAIVIPPSTTQFTLSFTQYPNGKPAFALNSVLFNPVSLSLSNGSLSDLMNYQNAGFNMIYTPVDYNDVIGNTSLENFLTTCQQANMPVIVELDENSLWSWLESNLIGNMQLSPDYSTYTNVTSPYLQYYPDIMNPSTRAYHTNSMANAVAALSTYFHNPIVGFSIGAYDNYHMPDGENHIPQWNTIYPHPKGEGLQTWLPYGIYAQDSYQLYLTISSTNISQLGFSNVTEVYAPWDIDTARNLSHWQSWLLYRRWYIREYLKATVGAIKQHTNLLVTGTVDPDFDTAERYSSLVTDFDGIFDFPIYYPWGYGVRPDGTLDALLQTARYDCWSQGKPLMVMKEFTSDISTPSYSADTYLGNCLPYASGFEFQDTIGSTAYDDFTTEIYQINQNNSWSTRPTTANIGVYVSLEDVNNMDKGFWTGMLLYHLNKSWDVLYSLESINQYSSLYVPSGQPVFLADSIAQSQLSNYSTSGGQIVNDLLNYLSTPNLITDPSFESGGLSYYSQGVWAGSPVIAVTTTNPHTGSYSLSFSGVSSAATVWQTVNGINTSSEYVGSLWMYDPVTNRTTEESGTCTLEWKSNGTPYFLGPGFGANSMSWASGWTQIYYPMNSANATQFVLVCTFYEYGSGTGAIWFDDLELNQNNSTTNISDWELY